MFFDFGRNEGFPTQYPSNPTPVTVDVLEAGLITAFVILIVSFLISLPTSRLQTNVFLFVRVTITLLIGFFLLFGNFGQEWEVGEVFTKTPYKAGLAQGINASVSIKIGLRSVNITLKSDNNPGKLQKEIIDYNERFSWTWDQGRFGFGPYAGHLQQEFRAAQYRGLPIPILWIAEYFVIDGEGFRFGRFYRTAGWYCHIALWSGFACWLLCLVLFRSVIRYGAYCLAICGVLQLVANLVWLIVRNPKPLVIPFEDGIITTKFGTSYWLVFSSGVICIFVSIVIVLMDYKYDTQLYTFFGVDPLNIYEEVAYMTKEEQMHLRCKKSDNIQLEIMAKQDVEYIPVYLKRHSKAPPVIRSNKPKKFTKV